MRTYRTLAAAAAAASLAVVAAGCSGDQPAAAPTPTVTVTVTVTPTPEMNPELVAAACRRYSETAREVDGVLDESANSYPMIRRVAFDGVIEELEAAASAAPEPLASQMEEAIGAFRLLADVVVNYQEGDTIDQEYLAWSTANRKVLATCGS